jgi:hypothetical protein
MADQIVVWLFALAAGAAFGHFVTPEMRQRRLDAASVRARKARLARIQRALVLSQLSE